MLLIGWTFGRGRFRRRGGRRGGPLGRAIGWGIGGCDRVELKGRVWGVAY